MRCVNNNYITDKYFIRDFKEIDGKYIIRYANKNTRTVPANENMLNKIRKRLLEQANKISNSEDKINDTIHDSRALSIFSGIGFSFCSLASVAYIMEGTAPVYTSIWTATSGIWLGNGLKDLISAKKDLKDIKKYKFYLDNKENIPNEIEEIDSMTLKQLKSIKENIINDKNFEYFKNTEEKEEDKKLTK